MDEAVSDADLERRFGGLARLYGPAGYARVRALRVAVVGLGGVGSWAVEALARSGVAALTLIDFDQVSESNINRQIQATTHTVGQAKGDALAVRIASIHPGCAVQVVDEFAAPENWPALLAQPVDAVIDACDQLKAKLAVAAWAMAQRDVFFVCCGAAGGKRDPTRWRSADLGATTHDALLSALRARLRQQHGAPRKGRMGLTAVYSDEPSSPPQGAEEGEACASDGSLNCHGYGSSITVTATAGLVAAAQVLEHAVGAAKAKAARAG